jgi:TonB family protein
MSPAVLVFALSLWGTGRPPSRKAAEAALVATARKAWVGKAWFLRGFPHGDEIRFAADGSPLKRLKPGPWTLADMEITDVRGAGSELDVFGWRVGLRWRPKAEKFAGYRLQRIEVRIRLGRNLPGPGAVTQIGKRLFIATTAALARAVPRFWRPFVLTDLEHRAAFPVRRAAVRRCRPVRKPRVIYSPNPTPNRWAGQAMVAGSAVLRINVTAAGRVGKILVLKPIGMGLDDRAVAAVRSWRFKPASCRGKPVRWGADITVNFHPY